MMDPQYPKNNDELKRMLHAGMGRAILFLLDQDPTQFRDMILDSCLHNYAYDAQCEDIRAAYLLPLIKIDKDFYRKEILKALAATEDWDNIEQLLDFAVIFAREGDTEARDTLYEKVKQQHDGEYLAGDDQIIELDGIQGLLFVLDIIGSSPSLRDHCNHDFIIREAEDEASVEEVRLALKVASTTNPNIAAALESIGDYSPDWTTEEIARYRKAQAEKVANRFSWVSDGTTWDEVKNHPQFDTLVFHWRNLASNSEIEKAASDLDSDQEIKSLTSHLRIFHDRPFPLDPDVLIPLTQHPNERVAVAALNALEIVEHPKVRELFSQLIADEELSDRAIGLLRANYRNGDDIIITNLLKKETDQDRLHSMCHDTIYVYRDNHVPEGIEPLLLVYEIDPCSLCRRTCMEALEELTELPDWMVRECLYDSDSRTREMAQGLINQLNS